MGHEPHRFEAVPNSAKATAEDVLMVIAALPFIRGNPKNLWNGHLTNRRRSWNAD
jgi:hypothetical protein